MEVTVNRERDTESPETVKCLCRLTAGARTCEPLCAHSQLSLIPGPCS